MILIYYLFYCLGHLTHLNYFLKYFLKFCEVFSFLFRRFILLPIVNIEIDFTEIMIFYDN
jgi:hypothetical protein